MKRILINALQPEELRVAIVHGQHLYDLDIQLGSHNQRKSSIYKGQINRIEPSLEAAFVDYGAERHGFLPFREIAPHCFTNERSNHDKPLSIKDAIKEGQEFEVQIEKEARGTKGATLTTFLSLAGRYMVLMPNNPSAGGVSRRVDGKHRTELRESLSKLDIPDSMGVIIRTAGVDRSVEELQTDLDYLLRLWEATRQAAAQRKAPFLIYQESNVIIRTIRDYFSPDIAEVVVDKDSVYRQVYDFVSQVMPEYTSRVTCYAGRTALFSHYQIESQIESVFSHTVMLPSGSSLVIDTKEALVAIDINSARATRGGSIEETALNTNLEAADEIARQLRLRDLGGLIVIDFIDMGQPRHRFEVEERLRNALQPDRARIQIGRISRFGLLEMSRQRLRPSLGDSSLSVCRTCQGQGYVRGLVSLALAILRQIDDAALKGHTKYIIARLPRKVATFLLNEKRSRIIDIERATSTQIMVIPDTQMDYPNYEIKRVREDDQEHVATHKLSYAIQTDLEQAAESVFEEPPQAEKPMVQAMQSPAEAKETSAARQHNPQSTIASSVWGRILAIFSLDKAKQPLPVVQQQRATTDAAKTHKEADNVSVRGAAAQQPPRKRTATSRNSRSGSANGRQQRRPQPATADSSTTLASATAVPSASEQSKESPVAPEQSKESPVAPEQSKESPVAPEQSKESPVALEQSKESPVAPVAVAPAPLETSIIDAGIAKEPTAEASLPAATPRHYRSHATNRREGYRSRPPGRSHHRSALHNVGNEPVAKVSSTNTGESTPPPPKLDAPASAAVAAPDSADEQQTVILPTPPPLTSATDSATKALSVPDAVLPQRRSYGYRRRRRSLPGYPQTGTAVRAQDAVAKTPTAEIDN